MINIKLFLRAQGWNSSRCLENHLKWQCIQTVLCVFIWKSGKSLRYRFSPASASESSLSIGSWLVGSFSVPLFIYSCVMCSNVIAEQLCLSSSCNHNLALQQRSIIETQIPDNLFALLADCSLSLLWSPLLVYCYFGFEGGRLTDDQVIKQSSFFR